MPDSTFLIIIMWWFHAYFSWEYVSVIRTNKIISIASYCLSQSVNEDTYQYTQLIYLKIIDVEI